MIKKLVSKFNSKKFKVGVIGLGYVGLPICERFSRAGVEVIGVDNDSNKIKILKKGLSYIKTNKLKNFKYFKDNKKNLSTNYNILGKCEAILICLPTPLKNSKPDMSYIFDCAKKLKRILNPYQLLVLESTVYPGATDELINIISNGKVIFNKSTPNKEPCGVYFVETDYKDLLIINCEDIATIEIK